MKVHELIAELSHFDPQQRVVIPGYEGGVDDLEPEDVRQVMLCLDVNTADYLGAHEVVSPEELAAQPEEPDPDGSLDIVGRPQAWKTLSRKEEAVLLGSGRG